MAKLNLQKFVLISASFLIIALLIIFYFINNVLRLEIQKTGELANATLTRIFVNETWSEINPLLPPPGSSEEEIKNNINIKKVDSRVRRFMSYTDVLKVKIYAINGMTLYSSDFNQIGENKSNNIGFQQALKGQLASELTYRGQFGSFDGELYNRNLVSTYAPIRDGYQVVAVAEIYSDRTALIQQADEVRNQLFLILFSLFGIIYCLMLYFSYKIYKRISLQSFELTQNSPESNFESFKGQLSQKTNQNYFKDSRLPLPQLSLTGIEKIIQCLFYAKNSNLHREAGIDPKNLLSDLSNQAEIVIDKITKYRNIIALGLSEKRLKNLNFAPTGFIKKVTSYVENNKFLTHVKIQHNKNLPDQFTQNEDLILTVITSFLDLIAYTNKNPEVLIKINFDEKFISINLITDSTVGPDLQSYIPFQELDYLIHAVSQRQSFNYIATLSDKGLLITLTFDQMPESQSISNNEVFSEAVIFGDSKLEMSFLSSNLKRLGINSISLVEPLEFNSYSSPTTNKLVFILQHTLENPTVAINLIDHLKKMGFDSKNLILITDSSSEDQFDNNYFVLPIPFDLSSLSNLMTRKV